MKRNRLGRRGGLPRDAEQLLWLANGLADSSSRAEDHFWDQRLADAVATPPSTTFPPPAPTPTTNSPT